MRSQYDPNSVDLYRIRVRGRLAPRWSDWFDGFQMSYHNDETVLTGPVVDQSALHGVLAKIRDLGLPILLVENMEPGREDDESS